MENKQLGIGAGLASVAIGGYYFYSKSNKNAKSSEEEEEDMSSAFLKYQPYEPPATVWSDLKVLKAMWFAKITGEDLQDRLDSFYDNQADLYDSYRFRMLHGRPKFLRGAARHVQPAEGKKGIVWVDLACGTGANTENFAESLKDGSIEKVYLVDLCRPLCEVARRERGEKYGLDKVHVVHGDVTDENLEGLPPAGTVDLVTISYSMVMIPDWKKCIANAKRLLRPGGVMGVADFTVAPDQSDLSKKFWISTFEKDHVFLSPEHLPTLQKEFTELESGYDYGTLPYTPFFLKAAYYHFVGKKE
jgi:S-adenosylmethionine-diacylgycerolhomoserine-N-methlytransferase